MDWNLTPAQAIALQKELRKQVRLVPLRKQPELIGGCDVSMNRFAKEGFGGFVTLSYPSMDMVDHSVVKETIPFPYIPGLLSFREIPMLLGAWEKLKSKPDVLLVDGVGVAHPRGMGIATHLGLELGIPTIGCAKSVLYGTHTEPGSEVGDLSYMYDPKQKTEVIGAALRTRQRVKPIYISVGNRITLEESIAIVARCVKTRRLPEPTRLAHTTVNEYRVRDVS
jgi:deoxyribonuclease V